MSPRKSKTDKEAKPAMTRKRTGARKASPAPSSGGNGGNGAEDLRARIARRAYELYVQRGYQPGHELDDWIQAEREILGR